MFEDKNQNSFPASQTPQQNTPQPQGGRNALEDIFADVDMDFQPAASPQAPAQLQRPQFPNASNSETPINPNNTSFQSPAASVPQASAEVGMNQYELHSQSQNPFPVYGASAYDSMVQKQNSIENMVPQFPQNPMSGMPSGNLGAATAPTQPLTALPDTGSSPKKWIIILVLVVVLIGGSVFAYTQVESVKESVDDFFSSFSTDTKPENTTPTPNTDQSNNQNSETPSNTPPSDSPDTGNNNGDVVDPFANPETPTDTNTSPIDPLTGLPIPTDNTTLPDTNVPSTPVPPINVNSDSDLDGLTDKEEETLGLDPLSVDTDADGLFDYEEVKIFKTNPLNPDTDKDGYSDGDEVKNHYNPNGPGKLPTVN